MTIHWKRVPRNGFAQSHWLGTAPSGHVYKIWQTFSGRLKRTSTTYMARMDHALSHTYANVAAAKAAAEKGEAS